MFNNYLPVKCTSIALVSAAVAAVISTPAAFAATEESANVERIQVTGSRIKRTDIEGTTPVNILTAKDIEDSGLSTISEFLRNTVSVGGFNESATLSQTAGAASVGLKGFGSSYTLILLNGRRLPKNAAGGVFTDINQIPMAAVNRIEVLTDSASAVYGSDAIAGVINIITKSDFDGFDFKAKYGAATKHQDGDEFQLQMVAGTSTEKMNIMFAGEYLTREPIQFTDREMGNSNFRGGPGGDGSSGYGIPGFVELTQPKLDADGNIVRNDDGDVSYTSPVIPWSDCEEANSWGGCKYSYAHLYQVAPKANKVSMFTSVNYTPIDDLVVDAQFRYTRMDIVVSNGAAPGYADITESPYLADFITNDIYKDDPEAAKFFLDSLADPNLSGTKASVGRRYLGFGNREKDVTNDSFEAVMGADYTISDLWSTRFDLGYSSSTGRQIGRGGQLIKPEVEAKFADGTLNPFIINDCQSAELKATCDALQASIHRTGEFDMLQSTWSVSGGFEDLLSGGDIGLAFGVDYRSEEYLDRSDPASVAGTIIGGAGSNGGGSLTNTGVFLEVSLPVLDNLDIELAVRQDNADWDISDASELTYSGRIGYRPMDGLLLRANYGTGFKAPDLDYLFLAESRGVTKGIDQLLCNKQKAAGGSASEGDCATTEINSRSGGNPNLEPETSKSWGAGFSYDITDDLSLTVDYWSLELENIISSLSLQEILDDEAVGRNTHLVTRHNGGIRGDKRGYVETNLQNLTQQSASGIIWDLAYSHEFSFGTLKSGLYAEQFLTNETQSSAVQPLCDWVADDATRKWNGNAHLGLTTGDWTNTLSVRYLPGYEQYQKRDTANKSCDLIGNVSNDDGTTSGFHHASYTQWDWVSTYDITGQQSVTLGVRNLFDAQPSFSQWNSWPFYQQSVYSNIGRFAYLEYNLSL
ncbi:TonB-dependent receptor plug domain-containing protein [Shewanella sp. 10N.286.54.B9]|uniref:TonB-dependent receptor plug domain-containing protein n=1 Tax=Shewanella sp. 10N.286.54.B9 TaxID=3229719 RepID=UPI0035534914